MREKEEKNEREREKTMRKRVEYMREKGRNK